VSAKKFWGGRGQRKHQDREIVSISLPPFYQWRVRGHIGHASRAYFKGLLHQECPDKKSRPFMEKLLGHGLPLLSSVDAHAELVM